MANIKDFAELKGRMQVTFLDGALRLSKAGRYVDAASAVDDLKLSQDERKAHAEILAYTYYRRSLVHQVEHRPMPAIIDLEKALNFPAVSEPLRSLIQSRLTAIQTFRRSSDIAGFDHAINEYFQYKVSHGGLLGEFLLKHALNRPQRQLRIPFVDALSSVSVYRWQGDLHYGETWTQLIRKAKTGDQTVIAFLGRILAEHLLASSFSRSWLAEIDYIVPVPGDPQRAAEREADVVQLTAVHLARRIGLPVRTDLLKRAPASYRSREIARQELASQYSLDQRKAPHLRGRTVLLIDDVVTHGHTASVCAEKLKALGCAKVLLLTLAQAESSLKSQQHFGEVLTEEARNLSSWICLADTDKLGPVRIKALLARFRSPDAVLRATPRELSGVSDIGPKLTEAIAAQGPKLDEYAIKAAQLLDTARSIGARILTLNAAEYPQVLKGSNAAPAILFVLGSRIDSLSNVNTVSIVGTRRPVQDAAISARQIARALAEAGWVVVSGMADGIDSLAHSACLEAGQSTIAFLGNGVDVVYPPSAKLLRQDIIRNGALISEYPFGARTNENQLRRRNSLTVGHSRAVIVIQTATDGGTMIAARAAKLLGRPLFCLDPLPGYESQFSGNAELLSSQQARSISPQNPLLSILAAIKDHAN
jgi:DNA processing protein